MVEFAGYDMPVQYPDGMLKEHEWVRGGNVGIFDVSHMGEIEIKGRQALDMVQHLTSNDASKLADNQAHYSGLMTPNGCFVDDILVHRFAADHYFLCVKRRGL